MTRISLPLQLYQQMDMMGREILHELLADHSKVPPQVCMSVRIAMDIYIVEKKSCCSERFLPSERNALPITEAILFGMLKSNR